MIVYCSINHILKIKEDLMGILLTIQSPQTIFIQL